MLQVRRGVFETNSSSTHSITLCSVEDYNAWQEGKMYMHRWDDKLYTEEQVRARYKESIKNGNTLHCSFDSWLDCSDFYTYDRYCDSIDMETFEEHYTTKSGDNVIAFGYYGYDG